MKIVICDDLERDLKLTEKLCREYLAEHRIEAEVFSAACWEELPVDSSDLVILDIEMPGKNGIELKEELSGGERPLILFVSGYMDYIQGAFGKNVMGFIQKPLEKDELWWYMDRVVIQLTAGKNVLLENGRAVSTEKIRMITADNRYTTVQFGDGTRSGIQSKSLSTWEKELEGVYFLRISQSALINPKFAIDFVDDVITMEDGEKLKTSRRRKKDCFARFMEYNRKFARPK